METSRKTVTTDEFIRSEYGDLSAENGVAEKDAVLKEYFPNGAGMSEIMEKHATTMDDAWVETYTLNGDGTITYLKYVPR